MCDIDEKPDTGCYINGLFIEGARWDNDAVRLTESRAKELYTEMAAIWFIPTPDRKAPTAGIYICPIYKTLTRAGQYPSTRTAPPPSARRRCSSYALVPRLRYSTQNRQMSERGSRFVT